MIRVIMKHIAAMFRKILYYEQVLPEDFWQSTDLKVDSLAKVRKLGPSDQMLVRMYW